MNIPKWQQEFPVFPASDMPEMSSDWEDVSWHNDACPCFYNAKHKVFAWVNRRDRNAWEYEDDHSARIIIMPTDHKGEILEFGYDRPLCECEEWSVVEAMLNDDEVVRRWICDRWTVCLGLGWHPDSEGKEFKSLSDYEQREYDADMNRLWAISPDPYADGIAAWERAGLVKGQ